MEPQKKAEENDGAGDALADIAEGVADVVLPSPDLLDGLSDLVSGVVSAFFD